MIAGHALKMAQLVSSFQQVSVQSIKDSIWERQNSSTRSVLKGEWRDGNALETILGKKQSLVTVYCEHYMVLKPAEPETGRNKHSMFHFVQYRHIPLQEPEQNGNKCGSLRYMHPLDQWMPSRRVRYQMPLIDHIHSWFPYRF